MLKVASKVIQIVSSSINSGLIAPIKNQYDLCLLIATLTFGTSVDRQDVPYIQHCLRVSSNPRLKGNTIGQCAALLHDTIEDTDLTVENLLDLGVDSDVVLLVKNLTHTSDLSYEDYIDNIIHEAIYNKKMYPEYGNHLLNIKLSDIEDNTQITRNYSEVNEKKIVTRHLKYMKAYSKLQGALCLLDTQC